MPPQKNSSKRKGWANLISVITTPLGFFVLALLIVESTLAIVLSFSKLTEEHVWEGFRWMIGVLGAVVGIVTLFAMFSPKNLLYGKDEHREGAVGDLAKDTAKKLQKTDLETAAQTIQKLLSPAAPLALGYFENFVAKMKKGDGGVQVRLRDQESPLQTKIFSIYIPHALDSSDTASTSLVHVKYEGQDIQGISIESNNPTGRTLTGFAIRLKGELFPVDVPQTLTSISLVFEYRQRELEGEVHMDAKQIKELQDENLDEFARILEDQIEVHGLSHSVRVIRELSHLFPAKTRGN